MMRAADLVDNIVVNLIEIENLDDTAVLQAAGLVQGDLVECPYDQEAITDVSIGWRYINGTFNPPLLSKPGEETPA